MSNSGNEFSKYCHVYGKHNSVNMVIFGPVDPVWSGGDFCSSLVEFFVEKGYMVFVIDSLHFLHEVVPSENTEKVIEKISSEIKNGLPRISIIAGYALGGTIAMKVVKYIPTISRLLCLSAPGYVDKPLNIKLENLLSLLRSSNLKDSLALLSRYVAPKGGKPNLGHIDELPSEEAKTSACSRMIKGFEFLLKLDARPDLQDYDGKILCILGEHAQMSTVQNQAITANSGSENCRLEFIPEAGMRVLQDNPKFTLNIIKNWLSNEK